MLIYFQVIDRTIRTFLNEIIPRLPLASGAGETPPGLTDALIFYDPLVSPTRPGTILPANLVALVESGQKAEAEKVLIDLIRDAAAAKTVEQDGELEMLMIEEEENRTRLKHIEQRQAHLKEVADQMATAVLALRDWCASPSVESAADRMASEEVPVTEAPPAGVAPPGESTFYAQLSSRVRSVMDRTNGILSASEFDEGFHLALDIGLSPSASPADTKKILTEMKADGILQTRRVLYVSDYLGLKFSEIYQLRQIVELEDALASIRKEWEDVNSRMSRLQKKQMDVLHASKVDMAVELDRLVLAQYRYFVLETKRRRLALTVDEKKQYGILSDEIENVERRIDTELYLRFHSSSDFLSTFRRLRQATLQSLHELIDIEENEREKKGILDKLSEPYRQSSPKERMAKMDEQIQRLTQFAKLLMSRGRQRPFAPVQPPPWPVTPKAALAMVEQIHSLDQTLFPEKFLRRRGGPPAILLFPCFGSGLYDWRDGMLVISLYPDNLQTAVLAAIAEFRIDADESKELFNSYSADIKRNRNLGFVRLKEAFVSDYVTWLGKEAAGYRVMEKDVRAWFERKIPLTKSERKGR